MGAQQLPIWGMRLEGIQYVPSIGSKEADLAEEPKQGVPSADKTPLNSSAWGQQEEFQSPPVGPGFP